MPISSFAEARDAILELFTTAWDAQTAPVPELFYDDVRDDIPTDADPWARIQVRHNTAFQSTVGGRTAFGGGGTRFRRVGIVTVQIFTRAGRGLTDADKFAKVANDAFEGKSAGSDGIEFRNVRMNEIGQEGDWIQVNVLADFEYDEIK